MTAQRPYLHWHLAVELATPDADDVRRGTAIHKLWNAVESRVKMLHAEYDLSSLKGVLGWSRRTDRLQTLHLLGLARPLILLRLKELRNIVEHQDQCAPPYEDCSTYIDTVWYFLRSTDIFASRRISTFEKSEPLSISTGPRRPKFISFDFDGQEWLPAVRGCFSVTEVATHPHPEAIELNLSHSLKPEDDGLVYVRGSVAPASPHLSEIVRHYFLVDLPNDGTANGRAE